MKGKSLFRQIDEAIFRAVDQLKAQQAYAKFQESIGKLGEQQQKIVNLSLSYILLLLPLFAVCVLWFMNSTLRQDIAQKRAVISEIEQFTSGHATTNAINTQIALQAPIAAQSELQVRLSQVMARAIIPASLVNLRNFEEGESAGSLRQFNAEVSFDKLSTKQFADFVKELETRERIRISALQIENDLEKSMLKGRLNLSFLTKVNASEQ